MFYITKIFDVPIGHRLSKLKNSKCFNIHGHNIQIEVTLKSKTLDKNDMLMDFSDLKKLVMKIIDHWDHALFLNENDEEINNIKNCSLRKFKTDPTAEVLCQFLYDEMTYLLSNEIYEIDSERATKIKVHSVSIWESSTSKATYIEE